MPCLTRWKVSNITNQYIDYYEVQPASRDDALTSSRTTATSAAYRYFQSGWRFEFISSPHVSIIIAPQAVFLSALAYFCHIQGVHYCSYTLIMLLCL